MRSLSSSRPKKPLLILLVDDHKMGLSARRSVLEELGHRTVAASSPEEALNNQAWLECDLLVTDYKMPRINGVELIRRLHEQRPAVPVILISGYADSIGLNERDSGASTVIQKNANEVSHLVRAVNRLVNVKPARKPASRQTAASKNQRKSG
ncbi:MAG: response regulator [Acidobacteria bacterium]|nr:response regulator [Acidobacteriota bacterium]